MVKDIGKLAVLCHCLTAHCLLLEAANTQSLQVSPTELRMLPKLMSCVWTIGFERDCSKEEDSLVGALAGAQRPEPLEAVVERGLQAVRRGVPEFDGAVLRAGDDDGELRVEADSADVVPVALQRLHAGLGLVVPHLGHLVVCPGDQVRPVPCTQPQQAVSKPVLPKSRQAHDFHT